MKLDWWSMDDLIIIENIGATVVLRFNRPQIKNPLSIAVLEKLDRVFTALESERNVEKVIFTGTGDAFASGASLKEIAETPAEKAREFALRGQTLMQKIYQSNKLTVAAIDGFCMGGALDLAVSCRTRIASLRSIFAHPGANLGIMTGWSGTQILPRLIGEAKALEMFLTAQRVGAEEALRVGLITAISANPLADALQIEKPNALLSV
ncbi:MAG: enoyl-CoA hydratase/isomerase family protein [Pyrinomonadaceae bacterium]|nr:enoyl-CoA hydratase/isomerase family protein [Pyrinomonadaceae bacterium]